MKLGHSLQPSVTHNLARAPARTAIATRSGFNLHLRHAGCFTLFATHFGRLGQLATMYPNARVWHLAVSTGAAGERLTYTRRLEAGAAEDQHYGMLLAGAVGIPAEVRTTSTCCCNNRRRQVRSVLSASNCATLAILRR